MSKSGDFNRTVQTTGQHPPVKQASHRRRHSKEEHIQMLKHT